MIGPDQTMCINGKFTPDLGLCTADIDEKSEVVVSLDDLFSICVIGVPPPPIGIIRYSRGGPFGPFVKGTAAFLICPSGYYVDGSCVTTCNGASFNPTLGVCRVGESNSTLGPTQRCAAMDVGTGEDERP